MEVAMERQQWTTIYVSQGILAAEVVKSKLELAGIRVLLEYESLGPVLGLTVDGLGKVEVTVPEEDVEAALALLDEEHFDADEDELPDDDIGEI
jgi:hypothetical protein